MPSTNSSADPPQNRSMIFFTARTATFCRSCAALKIKVRPSMVWLTYPFSSSLRSTVRIVDSFIGRVLASASRQASAEHGPCAQTCSSTACSTSPRFLGRGIWMRAIVALQHVTLGHELRQVENSAPIDFLRAGVQRVRALLEKLILQRQAFVVSFHRADRFPDGRDPGFHFEFAQ